MTHTIEVKLDPSIHLRSPEGEFEEVSWAALDTAWNLLRETAVKLTLISLREQAAEQGVPFPATDEELFREAKEAEGDDAPDGYRDLAPDNELAAAGLHAVLQVLLKDTWVEAQQAILDKHEIDSL